jgi:hypothetical protein
VNIDATSAWLGLLLLGALHGINPGMGWLFAVALGLQERSRAAVWRALAPLATGHALSIAVVVLLAGAVGWVVPLSVIKWMVAAVLVGFGFYRLMRSRHPTWGGMRVGARDLILWSFLMASAHGAGLMVLPLFFGLKYMGTGIGGPGVHGHAAHVHAASGSALLGGSESGIEAMDLLLAGIHGDHLVAPAVTLLHTGGYLLVTALVAVVVYEKLGLRFLRSLWFNLDRVWAAALIVTGIATPFV